MNDVRNELLKQIPSVDRVLSDERLDSLINRHPRALVAECIREYVNSIRKKILNDDIDSAQLEYDLFITVLRLWLEFRLASGVKRAVNGLGIILHTGLGRAPISEDARQSLAEAVANYSTLQIDRATGRRGDRFAAIESLLCLITGAEAGIVVNNNAAATLLILNTLASGNEVIISRGELVEIGGSFRIPDIMARSGAIMVEVGTTNRTHLKDYEQAISENTGLILRVHKSNYKIIGFTGSPSIEELVKIAHHVPVPVVDDLGSGALVDLSRWGLPKEPMVQDSIKAGADVVCFSGDKLIGGPQCGIIVGKKIFIDRIRKNQLTRALRCGKMTHAVLESTLRLFLDESTLLERHPVLRMLTEPPESIKSRCLSLKRKLINNGFGRDNIQIEENVSEVGSGSLAGARLPTWVLAIQIPGVSADSLARSMRMANPPIFGRVRDNKVLLDGRTIRKDEFEYIVQVFDSHI